MALGALPLSPCTSVNITQTHQFGLGHHIIDFYQYPNPEWLISNPNPQDPPRTPRWFSQREPSYPELHCVGYNFKGANLRTTNGRERVLRTTLEIIQWSFYQWLTEHQNRLCVTLSIQNAVFRGGEPSARYGPYIKITLQGAGKLILTDCTFENHVKIILEDSSSLDFCDITFRRGLDVYIWSDAVGMLKFIGVAGAVGVWGDVPSGNLPNICWERRRQGVSTGPLTEPVLVNPPLNW